MAVQKTPEQKAAPSAARRTLSELFAPFRDTLRDFWHKAHNLAGTNFDLGCKLVREGRIPDAIFRFRMVLWFDPNHAPAWYNLGCCLLTRGKLEEGIAALKRAIELKPDYTDAKFMLATVDEKLLPEKDIPRSMPRNLAVAHFQALAERYNSVQQRYNYQGHTLIHTMVAKTLTPERKDYVVIDLGCGTGLIGPHFRPIAGRLVGVDISSAMLAQAALLKDAGGKPIYDSLVEQDAAEYLATLTPGEIDIIVAANVVNFIGDLQTLLTATAKALRSGGSFTFSTEISPESGLHMLPVIGRFGHSKDYIETQAQKAGLNVVMVEEVELYPEYKALQVMLRKA